MLMGLLLTVVLQQWVWWPGLLLFWSFGSCKFRPSSGRFNS
uniref:Uncharacterized protein n=1 Tax=Nelumbo nucifera TaxID=4432 RepID=A0A822XU99_NELNU|nr:TPA_asm: hypothetical protein HUJ06_023939 [Nelumbo nucifera]